MEKNNFYTCNGVRGILDYVDGRRVFIPEHEIANTQFDYPDDCSCLTLDDSDAGKYNGETEIVETEVVNPQNEQRIIVEWVSQSYAESDEYERMLCVDTDSYYDWTSERTKMKNSIRRCLDKYGDIDQSLREEWNEIVARYSNTCEWDLPSVNFDDIVKEII